MRDLNIPQVEDPGRFFPDPVLLRPITYRRLPDGYGEVRTRKEKWERVHPICLDIIDGLQKGLDFKGIVTGCGRYPAQNITTRSACGRIARKFLWKLHRLGYVAYNLEEPPDVFADRYERIKELGRGGLGIAHLCRDLETGQLVTVKHAWGMKSKITSGQRATAVEIHLMGTLDHPSIPRLCDSFQVRGLLHLVREYVEGAKLSTVYASRQRPGRETRLAHARAVADILGTVHDAGWLFFDPSPDNFFLTNEGRVVASDLGGCKPHANGRIELRGPRGTGGYIATELRRRNSKGSRYACIQSDIYSFGCLYFYLTFGRRPGRTWRHNEIVDFARQVRPAPPSADLEIITSLTVDEPEDRPPSMRDVVEMLR